MNHRLTATAAMASILASTALFSLIMGGKWFWGGVGAVIVVAAAGTATRHRALRRLPAVACLLIALVALVVYLNLVYTARYSFLGVIPTGNSLTHLWNLAREGMADTQKYTSPVPPVRGLLLLATAGIGAIGAVTDLVAVRLRRSALAGLPLLALFIVPVAAGAAKNSLGTALVFCLGVVGYLALLGADGRERLRLWGKLVTPWQQAADEPADEQDGPNTRALAASGRRIGLAAVVLALFAPLLVPGLHSHKILPGHPIGPGPGAGAGGRLPDPLVQMNKDLQEPRASVVLTYHTSELSGQYLQAYVLSDLGTDTWRMRLTNNGVPVDQNATLPRIPGLTRGGWTRVRTTITIRQGTQGSVPGASFLPLPYPARVLSSQGGWQADPGTLMVYSTSQSLSGLTYTVISDDVNPTREQLNRSPRAGFNMSAYLAVPLAFHSLTGLAEKITKGETTPFAKAFALQDWFRSGRFKYSLNVAQPSGANSLESFLLVTRRGYCQQFAFAMAVLARLLGIPSRIAVGYTAGTSLGHGNWQVKTSDAHAWPELYFTGFGWLPWEPTPAGTAVGQGTAFAPAYSLDLNGSTGPLGNGGAGPTSHGLTPIRKGPGNPFAHKLGFEATGAAGTFTPAARHHHHNGPQVVLIVIGVLLIVALVGPRITRSLTRRRRWLTARDDIGRAHMAWRELLDDLADHGIGHGPGETPRALAKRVTAAQRLAEPAREALRRLAEAEERASYARQPASSGTLRADVATLRGGVSASVSQAARWRARLMPASVLARAQGALSHALDVFAWAEVATTRLRNHLPRPRTATPG
jgi:hypothetical protein